MLEFNVNNAQFADYLKATYRRWRLQQLSMLALVLGVYLVQYYLADDNVFALCMVAITIIVSFYIYFNTFSNLQVLAKYINANYTYNKTHISLSIPKEADIRLGLDEIKSILFYSYGIELRLNGASNYRKTLVLSGTPVVFKKNALFIPSVVEDYDKLVELLRVTTPNARKYEG